MRTATSVLSILHGAHASDSMNFWHYSNFLISNNLIIKKDERRECCHVITNTVVKLCKVVYVIFRKIFVVYYLLIVYIKIVYIKFLLLEESLFVAEILYSGICKSTQPEVFSKKGVPENIANFTAKYLRRSPFFNKVAGFRPATLLKKRMRHKCFPVSFASRLRTSL